MPCFHPLQAFQRKFVTSAGEVKSSMSFVKTFFNNGKLVLNPKGELQLPCGRCMGCRVERSRQWAVRCMHEAQLHEDNCFVTLTYSDECIPAGGTLVKRDMQLFIKRLRERFEDRKIRVFYCGEYGERLGRPHYHLCLFGLDFGDKVLYKSDKGFKYYNSPILSELWPYGHSVIGDLSFESAAYVARYCTKKINGDLADDHYDGRLPEFACMSNRPGIGRGWIDKYGSTDVWPFDELVTNGHLCKPPRYYDNVLKDLDSERFEAMKKSRRDEALEREDDNTPNRLASKEKCFMSRFRKLLRKLEKE